MILNVKQFQLACKKILEAVDTSSEIADMLELSLKDSILTLFVTNKEYCVEIQYNVSTNVETFRAIVNAKLFLALISKITTEEVELTTTDKYLKIKANGEYKIPLSQTFIDSNMLLPRIDMKSVLTQFEISGEILQSIVDYNSKELNIDVNNIYIPAQKMYYVDNKGCITFTSGACVNSFTLEKPINILLTNKVVKLFKLFDNESAMFSLGYDVDVDGLTKTKVQFKTQNICITSILPSDSSLLQSVPVELIRQSAFATYPYTVDLDKDILLQSINRLLLFSTDILNKGAGLCRFTSDKVLIYDISESNYETITYSGQSIEGLNYNAYINLNNLKILLESCIEKYISLSFGDDNALVLSRGNIKNIIAQLQKE